MYNYTYIYNVWGPSDYTQQTLNIQVLGHARKLWLGSIPYITHPKNPDPWNSWRRFEDPKTPRIIWRFKPFQNCRVQDSYGHFKTVVFLGWHHLVARPQAMKNTLAILLIYNKNMLRVPSSMGFLSILMECYKVIFQHCANFRCGFFQGRKVQSCTKIHKAVQTLLTLLSKTLISASTKALDLRFATFFFDGWKTFSKLIQYWDVHGT